MTSQNRNPFSMYWTYERELLMIKYFEQHRYLWDTDHILFHKRFPRMQGFAELVTLLGIDEATIRQRWSSMRSQFCREERKVAASSTYIPTWDHYESLLFLRKPNEEFHQKDEFELMKESNVFQSNDQEHVEHPENDKDNTLNVVDMTNSDESKRNTEDIVQCIITDLANGDQQQIETEVQETNTYSSLNRHRYLMPSQRVLNKKQSRLNRRLNPLHHQQQKGEVGTRSMPMNSERTKLSENECFSQYISSVLGRFSAEKQRKCRNELLRIILKYDTGDDVTIDPSK